MSRIAFALPVWAWLVLWMTIWVAVPVAAHYAIHGVVNGWHATLAFFLAINMLICIWEISLGVQIGRIERWHHDPEGQLERPRGLVWTARATPRDLVSTRLWARVWSEYAFYDPSYADRRSFGFAIDVGNGWSTLLPSLFFLVAMTTGSVSALALGLVGMLIFYQKLYGTSLYFFSYLVNRRYEGHALGRVLAMVGAINGIWLVFPLVGLYVCARLVFSNSFSILWT